MHIPQRHCVGCGKTAEKHSMVRVMRKLGSDGLYVVQIDTSGKGAGRGAYVCSAACFEKACKTHKFERVLRVKISNEAYESLKEQGKLLF